MMSSEVIKKLVVNGHVYLSSAKVVQNALKVAKDKYKKEKANAIYAVEKDNLIELLRETYVSKALLVEAESEYKSKGFRVYSVTR